MPIAEGLAALNSIKSLYEMIRDVRDSNDPERLRAAAAQMFDLALAAREQTAALQEERNAAMLELATLKTWETEKQRYEMKAPHMGATVYAPKLEMRGSDPPYWICANCYTQGMKRILYVASGGVMGINRWGCPECKTMIMIGQGIAPT